MLRHGGTADQAVQVLDKLTSRDAHGFWADDLSYGDVAMAGVIGHRQVTDAYLAALARHHGGRFGHVRRRFGGVAP